MTNSAEAAGAARGATAGRLPWPSPATAIGFAALYSLLLYAGYELKLSAAAVTTVWPAEAVTFCALALLRKRDWPAVVAIALACDVLVNRFTPGPPGTFQIGWALWFAMTHVTSGVVGALLVQRWIRDPFAHPLPSVARFYAAAAVSCGAGASLGVVAFTTLHPGPGMLAEWQHWWSSTFLGTATVVPTLYTWLQRWRRHGPADAVPSWPRLALLNGLLLAVALWVFSAPPASGFSGRLPFAVFPVLAVVALQGPPRWAMLSASALVVLGAVQTNRGFGPFATAGSPYEGLLALQVFLALAVAITFLLAVAAYENRRLVASLSISNRRYSSFLERTSEAVWRVELREPLPLALGPGAQREWLSVHAEIAEYSEAYRELSVRCTAASCNAGEWHAGLPWAAPLLTLLRDEPRGGWRIDGVQVTVPTHSGDEHWLVSYDVIVEHGRLVRAWGVAGNVTELVRTAARLQREQARLREYAWELGNAEDRARRAAAVDLHDGIGQLLVALSLKLRTLRSRGVADTGDLLAQAEQMLSDVQAHARGVIADLSPPGLYELGVGPALRWLAERFEAQGGCRVVLDVPAPEVVIDIEWRIFAFKIVRELLQNVAKHARARTAEVRVGLERGRLEIRVGDDGVGFELPSTEPGAGSRGFGLWSIADRVRAVGGTFEVDTAPSRGCRVTVSVSAGSGPLRRRFDDSVVAGGEPAAIPAGDPV